MPLRLTITSYHKLTPGQRADRELDRGELRIGRNPENDWVLPDPERLVSGQHCVIQFRDGRYYLTDTSTNGVQLVRAGVRMHRGNSELLQDGETIRMGEYEVLVQISTESPSVGAGLPDPFSDFDSLMARPPTDTPVPAPTQQAVRLQPGGSPLDTKPDLFDFLSAPAVPPAPQPDHIPSERHDFRPPQPLPSQPEPAPAGAVEATIPADWDPFAELGVSTSPLLSPAARQAAPEPHQVARPAPVDPFPEPLAPAPAEPVVAATPPIPGPAPAPIPAVTATAATPGRDDGNPVLEAFLRGAGISHLPIEPGQAEAQMEAVGRSYRYMVEGLIDVMRARASIKGEFRMAQTMIQPVENNPLKFAPNADEALLLLLRAGNRAFMAPDQAIAESFDDLKAHQLAVMAGIQAAIKHLLKRFEPAVLEARLEKPSGVGGLLMGGRQAKYWELFTELYASISREAEDDFQDLFGREFSRAYEEQIGKLRRRP